MTENPTMDDYLDGVEQSDPPTDEWDAPPDTTPQCRYCGETFDSRGYWLNHHEAHCEGDSDD